jgi:Holliday junction resolvasome RuvABC endonuclease subunit
MITLAIKDIEKKLGKTVRKETVSIGFDVAEAYTGVCILKTDKENIYIENTQVIETTNKEDHFNRCDHYVASLEKFKQTLDKYKGYKILVIERCYFGRSPETLIHLAHFGIITYVILKKEFDTYYYFGASTARSLIGFNQRRQEEKGTLKAKIISRGKNKGKEKKIDCKSLVHDYLKTDFNLEFDSKDKADAFVLALAGLLK